MNSHEFCQKVREGVEIGDKVLNISNMSRLGGERYDSVHITFFNVPADVGNRAGGAVGFNNRLLIFIDGFGREKGADAPGKVKFRVGAAELFSGDHKRPRGKTASPEKMVDYVVKVITEASKLPQKL